MNRLVPTLVLSLTLGLLSAARAGEPYRLPPQEVQDVVLARPSPEHTLSPNCDWILVQQREPMPSLARLGRRMLRLAGTRIDPAANGPFTLRTYDVLALRKTSDASEVPVPLPADAELVWVDWSHDSRHFAFAVTTQAGTELWSATVDAPGEPRRLTTRLNTILLEPEWLPSGDALLCGLVPEGRGPEPSPPETPAGPVVQETAAGVASPLRTYQDLLRDPHDERLFTHYATTQLAVVTLTDGAVSPVGPPALYRDASPSPDASRLLVSRIEPPFSYVMPWWLFPHVIEVWDRDGRVTRSVAEVPLGENIPLHGVRLGPRSVQWVATAPASLVWVEALDGGDPERAVSHRDRWLRLDLTAADDAPRELFRLEERARELRFLRDPQLLITREYDRDRRWTRYLLHDLSSPDAPRVLEDRSIRDRYGDPGRLLTEPLENGAAVVRQQGEWLLRAGWGASPQGYLPFFRRQSLKTLETEELWRCEPGAFESVLGVQLQGDAPPALVTRHETPTSPPNLLRRTLGEEPTRAPITAYPDPTPQIRGIKKQLVTYERDDGVPLSATLYLPADYEPGTRLPLLVWAYPVEFNDTATAGQVSATPWRFTEIRGASHLSLLTQGYAVLDGATIPIVGDPETMNDTFREQLVASAAAAIDKAVELGVADRDRVAVGGHSYGAFMTANLLAHCDLFRAGVARSGAYNRTLTPFGFQAERRTLWEAGETYFAISPFMHADSIDEPLLLIHGKRDNNSGTFPLQSERLFQALKGHGATARLVMLPLESHGYRARESVLHVLAETIDWLDEHVKHAEEPRSPR